MLVQASTIKFLLERNIGIKEQVNYTLRYTLQNLWLQVTHLHVGIMAGGVTGKGFWTRNRQKLIQNRNCTVSEGALAELARLALSNFTMALALNSSHGTGLPHHAPTATKAQTPQVTPQDHSVHTTESIQYTESIQHFLPLQKWNSLIIETKDF